MLSKQARTVILLLLGQPCAIAVNLLTGQALVLYVYICKISVCF